MSAVLVTQEQMQSICDRLTALESGSSIDSGLTESTTYDIQNFTESGFFFGNGAPNTVMNGQLQVYNTSNVDGPGVWEIRFDANYDITSFVPSGTATAGTIQQTDNGDTYSYIIPMTGVIGAFNQNIQVAIEGVKHPLTTDTTASHSNEAVYA